MLTKLAWRNIWRNKRRTFITTGSITLGLTLAIFSISMGDYMYANLIDEVAKMQSGHLTLQHPEYAAAPAVDLYLTGVEETAAQIASWPETERTKILILGQSIAKSGAGAVAAALMGVEPSKEIHVFTLCPQPGRRRIPGRRRHPPGGHRCGNGGKAGLGRGQKAGDFQQQR